MFKVFVLHDGEDDKKTEELHKFLQPVKDTGCDWEGDSSGITIVMSVLVGDVIAVGHDGGVRVLRKGEPVLITEHTFPLTYKAMLAVEYDNGAHHVNRICGPDTVVLDVFKMPYAYGIEKLVQCEEALAYIDEAELGNLVSGSEEDQAALIAKWSGLAVSCKLLDDWFNGWE